MREVFADTSGWAAFHVETEPFHAAAQTLLRQRRGSGRRNGIVTTNYVVAELVALLGSPLRIQRPRRIAIIDAIRTAPWVRIVNISTELDDAAWDLLKRRQDKDWSLVDCASFVVMDRLGITAALSTDHHFAQAGFERLLA